MARTAPIQTSFAGGELSPQFLGQLQTELYHRGLKRSADGEPRPQGSWCRRPGSFFTAMLPDVEQIRYIPMRLRDQQDYVLVLTDGELRVYSVDSGVLITAPGAVAELIVNGDFAGGLTAWQVYNGPTAVGNQCQLGPAGHAAQGRIYQSFTLGAEQDVVVSFDVIGTPTSFLRVVLGDGPVTPPNLPANRKIDANIPPASGTGTLSWTAHLPAGTYCLMLAGWDDNVVDNVSVAYDTGAGSSGYSIAAPWTGDQLAGIQFASESALEVTYLVHPDVAPYYVQRSPSGSWSLQAITFTAPPTEWGSGNWPGSVEVFQSRLWLGSTRLQANSMWGSRTGVPFDFNVQTETPPGSGTYQTLGTDGIVAPVATKGSICWFRGRQALLFGTDLAAEVALASSGVLQPTDFHVQPESHFGSAKVQAIDLGDEALYVSRDRRKARTLSYSRDASAWQSRDVTWIANHLTEVGIAEVHYAPEPNGTLVLLLQDGTLALCTYDRGEQVRAWYTAELSGGVIRTAAVSDGPEGSVLHLAVSRFSGLCFESMPFSEYHPSRVYCDSAKIVNIDGLTLTAGVATVAGFDHLEGEEVEVIIDGAYQGRQAVDAGTVEIGLVGTSLVVGLPYTSQMVTLRPEGGRPEGTAQGTKMRWVKIVVRLNDSAVPLVNGRRPLVPSRENTSDDPTVQRSGDVEITNVGGDDSGEITIAQDLPFRTEILAIFGQLKANEL